MRLNGWAGRMHSRKTDTAADLRYLLGHGSPLGGARPKSVVVLTDGRLAIAKFAKPDDIPETPVSEQLDENGIAAALSAAPRFGLNPGDSRTILREVFTAVSGWRQAGKALRLKASTLDAYETAFVNPHMTDASRV
jgi:hypothetical protein